MSQSTFAIAQRLDAAVPVVYGEFTKTVAASGTPERLKADNFFVHKFWVYGRNAARTNNTGTVWLGSQATNDTQPTDIAAGGEMVWPHNPGLKYNLKDFYLDVATNGDGLVVGYLA